MYKKSSKPVVTVVDAVMGTGKSIFAMCEVKERNLRTVIVVPRQTEVKRYKDGLKGYEDVVAISNSDRIKKSKTERFREALMDANVIITTHSLYEMYLKAYDFDEIKDGRWHLILDEVPAVFDPVRLVSGTTLDSFIHKDLAHWDQLNENVAQFVVNPLTKDGFDSLPTSEAFHTEKEFLRKATMKDVMIVKNEDNTRGFPSFSLKENRLDAFESVMVMTYPFKGSDLDYWLQIKGYTVEHKHLHVKAKTNSRSDFDLIEHPGCYSGRKFKDLVEIIDGKIRGQRNVYGDQPNHFSTSEMERMTDVKGKKTQRASLLDNAQNALRREFRNSKNKNKFIPAEDFMYTCLKSSKHLWINRSRSLNGDFLSDETFLAFNTTALNDYSHKHHLAFLHNVFPFPETEKLVQAFGLEYDRDQFALYTLIQWIWRSAIRREEKIRLYLPSSRMRTILQDWLNADYLLNTM